MSTTPVCDSEAYSPPSSLREEVFRTCISGDNIMKGMKVKRRVVRVDLSSSPQTRTQLMLDCKLRTDRTLFCNPFRNLEINSGKVDLW